MRQTGELTHARNRGTLVMNTAEQEIYMEITCQRPEEIQREIRKLPANLYNLARTLFLQAGQPAAFVAIRSIQYLAIIDSDEIVFIDGAQKNRIDIAWQNFHPGQRHALDEPVAFEAIYYVPDGEQLMRRLQPAFLQALQLHAERHRPRPSSRVADFRR